MKKLLIIGGKMGEMMSGEHGLFRKIESLSEPSDIGNEKKTPEERAEAKSVALRAVMDGTFEGTIFDSISLARILSLKGSVDTDAEVTSSKTPYKDKNGRAIVEIVATVKNHSGHLLSEKTVGFMVEDEAESIDNIVKFN